MAGLGAVIPIKSPGTKAVMEDLVDFIGKTFDDFLIRPHYGTVRSRKEIEVRMRLFPGYTLDVPVLAANMDYLTGSKMAIAMKVAGAGGVIPLTPNNANSIRPGRSISIRARQVKEDWAAKAIMAADFTIIDMAHGYSVVMKEALAEFKRRYPVAIVGAGNVASYEGAVALFHWGANFVKVGIGPGSCCTTRLKTACGVPQLQAIWECSKAGPIIADGGIRHEKDIALALLCGAKAVMLGGFFAGTDEAEGGNQLRGMSTIEADPTQLSPPEGIVRTHRPKGSVVHVVNAIAGYLRSTVSYVGADNLMEAQARVMRNPEEYLISLSAASQIESFVR